MTKKITHCLSCGEWLEGIRSMFTMRENKQMTWTCFICGKVVQKFSMVVSHVEKHRQDEQKPSSLLDAIYADWTRENK